MSAVPSIPGMTVMAPTPFNADANIHEGIDRERFALRRERAYFREQRSSGSSFFCGQKWRSSVNNFLPISVP